MEVPAALAAFLARAAGASRVRILRWERLDGGAIQENWALDAELEGGTHPGRLEAVVRTDAPSAVAASRSRGEEFALLRAAHAAGVTVPEPLWLCTDPGVLGRPFFVMRRLNGSASPHRLVREGRWSGDRDALAGRLGRELARLHRIRPPREDLAFLGAPPPDPAQAAVAALRADLDALGTPRPALEWGLRWLERHAPPPDGTVLAHRDFRTGNYLVDEQGLTAILDWEFAGWSARWEDLGWFCAKCWRFGAWAREAGGIAARELFYRGYEEEAGGTVDDAAVRWWEVLAHARWAVIALQQAARHLDGGEESLELGLTAHIVPELEWELLAMTKEGEA